MADLMAKNARLLQVFLSASLTGPISYVSLLDGDALACTCSPFRLKSECKHTRFVAQKIASDNYAIEVPNELAALMRKRPLTPEEYHHLVLHYGKVEVL